MKPSGPPSNNRSGAGPPAPRTATNDLERLLEQVRDTVSEPDTAVYTALLEPLFAELDPSEVADPSDEDVNLVYHWAENEWQEVQRGSFDETEPQNALITLRFPSTWPAFDS